MPRTHAFPSGRASLALLLIATFIRSGTAQAAWSTASRALIGHADHAFVRTPATTDISLWGQLRAVRDAGPIFGAVSFAAPAPLLGTGHLAVELVPQVGRAPLVVFLPGMFCALGEPAVRRQIRFFRGRGYHVLVLPNPWNPLYLRERPPSPPGTFEDEAQVVLQATRAAIARLGRPNVAGAFLFGESYGAMLSSVTHAIDGAEARAAGRPPVFRDALTLISPPLQAWKSVSRLDTMMDQNLETWTRRCGGLGTLAYVIARIEFAASALELSPLTRACTASVVAFKGFQEPLLKAERLVVRQRAGAGGYTPPLNRELRFRDVLKAFPPRAGKYGDETAEADLGFWLELDHRNRPRADIRILSARDDFLNEAAEWRSDSYYAFPAAEVGLLSWGGHLGYVGTPPAMAILESAFPAGLTRVRDIPASDR